MDGVLEVEHEARDAVDSCLKEIRKLFKHVFVLSAIFHSLIEFAGAIFHLSDDFPVAYMPLII